MQKLILLLASFSVLSSCQEKTTPAPAPAQVTKEVRPSGCERLVAAIDFTQVQTAEEKMFAEFLNFDDMLGHFKTYISEEESESLQISEGDECLVRICMNDKGEPLIIIMKKARPLDDLESGYEKHQDFKATAFCYTHYR